MRFNIAGTAACNLRPFGWPQRDRERVDDLTCHFVLDREDIVISRSKRSAQRWVPVAVSINWAVIRTRLPARRIDPSSIESTPSSRPTVRMSAPLYFWAKLVLRATTINPETLDRSVMMSSVMPSEKYCCSGSTLTLVNGSTAMDGLRNDSRSAHRLRLAIASLRRSARSSSSHPRTLDRLVPRSGSHGPRWSRWLRGQ